jgi:hypothetical protein
MPDRHTSSWVDDTELAMKGGLKMTTKAEAPKQAAETGQGMTEPPADATDAPTTQFDATAPETPRQHGQSLGSISSSGSFLSRMPQSPRLQVPRWLWVTAASIAVIAVVAIGTVWLTNRAADHKRWPGFPHTNISSIAAPVKGPIASAGKLVIGVNVPYAPNEFKDPSGKIVGFDIDLMNAVASELGLTTEYRESAFDKIIPSILGGTVDVGVSGMTNTKQREQSVDFVDYYSAGTLWGRNARARRSIPTMRATSRWRCSPRRSRTPMRFPPRAMPASRRARLRSRR